MTTFHRSLTVPMLVSAALLVSGPPLLAQVVELVAVDVKTVGQGYRTSKLTGMEVVNSENEEIGEIDDFVIGRDDHALFAVLQVGGFLGLGGHLVAVPFESLEVEDAGGKILLAGGTRDALNDLPEFEYQEN
jgi:sporulation protein YlmC with PRC-barrel domain